LKTIGKILDAWLRAQMGEISDTVERIREGLADLDVLKFYATRAKYLGYLCEAQAFAGAVDDAFLTVEQALQVNPDELIYRPETFRLRGELWLRRGETKMAEVDFHTAISLAQTKSAKAWELRATNSLAQMLNKLGRRDEAHTILADVYIWFTEGFDTADLKEAKALATSRHQRKLCAQRRFYRGFESHTLSRHSHAMRNRSLFSRARQSARGGANAECGTAADSFDMGTRSSAGCESSRQ
jgi:predicted ATPase